MRDKGVVMLIFLGMAVVFYVARIGQAEIRPQFVEMQMGAVPVSARAAGWGKCTLQDGTGTVWFATAYDGGLVFDLDKPLAASELKKLADGELKQLSDRRFLIASGNLLKLSHTEMQDLLLAKAQWFEPVAERIVLREVLYE